MCLSSSSDYSIETNQSRSSLASFQTLSGKSIVLKNDYLVFINCSKVGWSSAVKSKLICIKQLQRLMQKKLDVTVFTLHEQENKLQEHLNWPKCVYLPYCTTLVRAEVTKAMKMSLIIGKSGSPDSHETDGRGNKQRASK